MEMIKDIIKHFYSLMIAVSCVMFVVWVFFSSGMKEGKGVFEAGGRLFELSMDTGAVRNDGVSFIQDEVSSYIPLVRYAGGTRTVGEILVFKELLQVRKEDGSWVSGSIEDDFTIYLMDIRNQRGKSAMAVLSAEEIAGMEHISTAFAYAKEEDILCCFGNGIYTVIVKIYGANGSMAVYEFLLPVEVS